MSEYDLRSFGWALGDYLVSKCIDCKEQIWQCAKHSWRCQPCALKRYEEHAKVMDAPMICDYDEQTGRIG
jgi:hypothetical protein